MRTSLQALKNFNPVFFDVSLRDGLQTVKELIPLNEKKIMLNNIITQYNPKSIEVGSVVSSRVLPQMANSLELFKYAKSSDNPNNCKDIDYYLLIGNQKHLKTAINEGVTNFSLITSVSNSFQQRNTKKSLDETKDEIELMVNDIKSTLKDHDHKIKLYISCINECPIDGKLDNNYIINEIEYYLSKYNYFNEFCLSDTCGTLLHRDLIDIVDKLDCNHYCDYNKISLHLHYSNDENLMKIFDYCINKGIIKYDVSFIQDSGGCSVTMQSDMINGNLHYDKINSLIETMIHRAQNTHSASN